VTDYSDSIKAQAMAALLAGHSDDICTQLNGTTQTLAWAEKNPIQHPRCVRAFGSDFDT
jgi:hypothetical protein